MEILRQSLRPAEQKRRKQLSGVLSCEELFDKTARPKAGAIYYAHRMYEQEHTRTQDKNKVNCVNHFHFMRSLSQTVSTNCKGCGPGKGIRYARVWFAMGGKTSIMEH